MISRGDLHVVHEPFSQLYYFLERQAAAVEAEFSGNAAKSYEEIRDELIQLSRQQIVLFKDMCYHCLKHVATDEGFLAKTRHLFLIRDPAKSIASHYAMNADVTLEEIGIEAACKLFRRVLEADLTPVVVDADDLVANPEGLAKALFHELNLSECAQALRWEAGHRPEWDTWKAWHVEAAKSNKIEKRENRYAHTVENHEGLKRYYEHHLPFYQELWTHRIVP